MDWTWIFIAVAAAGTSLLLYFSRRSPAVDEEHCPYRVGTVRADCDGKPCELKPPCRVA